MWLVGLLAFLPGFVLGLLGGGGSILVTPLLLAFGGTGVAEAVATSLAVVGSTALAGAVRHARAGRVRLKAGLSFGVASMVGAYLGGLGAALVSPKLLLGLFAVMMQVTAFAMLRQRGTPAEAREAHPGKLAAIGVLVGSVTGLVGAGGGFLVVPALTLFGGLSMLDAIGTSLLVIAMQAGAGLLGHLTHVELPMTLVVVASAGAVVGMLVGAQLSHRVSGAGLKRAFALLVLALSVATFHRAGGLPLTAISTAVAMVAVTLLLLRLRHDPARAPALAPAAVNDSPALGER